MEQEIEENLHLLIEMELNEQKQVEEGEKTEIKNTNVNTNAPVTSTAKTRKTKRKSVAVADDQPSPLTKNKKLNPEKPEEKEGKRPEEKEGKKPKKKGEKAEKKEGDKQEKSKIKKGKEKEQGKAGKEKKAAVEKVEKEEEEVSVKKGGNNVNSDDKARVLEYLISQNRPYSLINIFDNLHGSIKKKALERILDQLVEEKEIICKEYNSKVFLAGQHHFPEVDKEDLQRIDTKLEQDREEITRLKQKLQGLQGDLKYINTQLTDEELDLQIFQKKKTYSELEEKLDRWQGGAITKVSDEAVFQTEKNYEMIKNSYKKMKRACINIIDTICEGMDLTKDELYRHIPNIEPETELFSKLKIKNI